ncbi:MAG TPA: tryptophan--tRNA ligase [Steroidobacteraceae bacterium]|nr:tryptophan--tRNA ligase [Steroidobacteraceae bacterium]
MRILSGIQPSGRLHLGNYYGALRQFVALQNEGDTLFFIANLHALTTVRDAAALRAYTFDAAVAYLSLGLDPSRATIFRQNDVPEIVELYWILGSLVPLSHLERAHGYKDKTARGIAAQLGLFAYPVLMAADILAFGTELVPVGKDQLQHIEFARDWATRFNVTFVPGYNPQDPEAAQPGAVPGVLRLPRARVQEQAALVPGIDGQKMSKSADNAIDLFATDEEVKRRIMSIKTDSAAIDAPKPMDSALYQLLKIMAPPDDFAELDRSWCAGGKGYAEYKRVLLDLFHATFDGARARRKQLMAAPDEVERVLVQGARRARAIAAPIMNRVRQVVGLPEAAGQSVL